MGRDNGPRVQVVGPLVRRAVDAVTIVKQLVCPQHHEGRLVLGLDECGRVLGAALHDRSDAGPADRLTVAEQMILLAAELKARALVLVTFVSNDQLAPTAADVARFEGLEVECTEHGVSLHDHVLMAGHQWQSVRDASSSPMR